jgi:hypothetical protein
VAHSDYVIPFQVFSEREQLLFVGEYYSSYFLDAEIGSWNDGIQNIVSSCPIDVETINELMPSAFAGQFILPGDENFDPNLKNMDFTITFQQLQQLVNGEDPENIGFEISKKREPLFKENDQDVDSSTFVIKL